MKKITAMLIGVGLSALAFTSIAATTSLDNNWTCKTNASSSSVASDKEADKQMSESAKSAGEAFAYAAKNCRDCTKITCEAQN